MLITKRKVKRRITEEEFIRFHATETQPFEGYRQDAKRVNFGFLFGMSYRKFTSQSLETSWSLEKIEAFIEEKGLQDELDAMIEKHHEEGIRLAKYFTVANYIRTNFFAAYRGLEARIKRNVAFARQHGYIRSHHGGIRKLPLFALAYNEEGKRREDEDGLEISNWSNICANTSIQTDEVATVMRGIDEWAENRDLDAWVIGTVHDSVDFYVARDQIVEALHRMKATFEKNDPWQKGLMFPVDIKIVDFTNPKHYYKKGTNMEEFLLQLGEAA